MIKRYVTESGSEYIIDFGAMTWKRKRGPKASEIRSDEGEFKQFSIIDKGIYLICPPFIPDSGIDRFILSTPIVSEEEI
jgi:hypothetical protein